MKPVAFRRNLTIGSFTFVHNSSDEREQQIETAPSVISFYDGHLARVGHDPRGAPCAALTLSDPNLRQRSLKGAPQRASPPFARFPIMPR
jgi:hypothetical protein